MTAGQNRSFSEVKGEIFSGEIMKSNFQGTVFRDCQFLDVKFLWSRLDRARFISCQGVDGIEFGEGCRAEGMLIDGQPLAPSKIHASVRIGKPDDSEALTVSSQSSNVIGYEEDDPNLPAEIVEEQARLDARKQFINETLAATDAAWSKPSKVIENGC